MLTALNAWYGSDKLSEQKGCVFVSLSNNYNWKRFEKKMCTCQFEKFAIKTGKIHNYSYFKHYLFFLKYWNYVFICWGILFWSFCHKNGVDMIKIDNVMRCFILQEENMNLT